NSAIAAHRTMYGHPFLKLDELNVGDRIIASTRNGKFIYRVADKTRVAPQDVSVLDQTEAPKLTLTTCDPVGSAALRLIVVAEYDRKV
ncbi:MAG TPA: class E sortase, partial [Actinobacteria bacterium]|nr:class E sortase [Actinomycetota bacterium]